MGDKSGRSVQYYARSALLDPYGTLITAFAVWKTFLLAITVGSTLVGDAYDTSASLALLGSRPESGFVSRVVTRLTSWDAIYFVTTSRRGYLFEQEWAFGYPLSFCIKTVVEFFRTLGIDFTILLGHVNHDNNNGLPYALAGVLIANTSHLLSALVLYRLGLLLSHGNRKLSLVAALLHVISPAGLFLSAPYAESTFALLSFTGYLLFAKRYTTTTTTTLLRDVYTVLAGLVFGLATSFRSNGILNGVPFAWEFIQALPELFQFGRPGWMDTVQQLVALGLGGLAVAAGSVIPQVVAYRWYCNPESPSDTRPWCEGYLPSIYTFVQQHYWNTGFLRYWVPGNIPLFLLAAPMLTILVKSGFDQLLTSSPSPSSPKDDQKKKPSSSSSHSSPSPYKTLLNATATAQILLAVLAFTSYHVQIISRISSGYPFWYLWLAGKLVDGQKAVGRFSGNAIVMFTVIYASIQGALFTSFLPPA